LVGKPEVKGPLLRHLCIVGRIILKGSKEELVKRIYLTQERILWQAFVNKDMNL
jgi:hypothetical protein